MYNAETMKARICWHGWIAIQGSVNTHPVSSRQCNMWYGAPGDVYGKELACCHIIGRGL
jgi:hypothetical protein